MSTRTTATDFLISTLEPFNGEIHFLKNKIIFYNSIYMKKNITTIIIIICICSIITYNTRIFAFKILKIWLICVMF